MIDRLIEKIGAKAFGALCALLATIVASLLWEIRHYFERLKDYQRGREDERKTFEEQQRAWEQKVRDIQENCDTTIREKIREMRKLKKAFREYMKRQEAVNSAPR